MQNILRKLLRTKIRCAVFKGGIRRRFAAALGCREDIDMKAKLLALTGIASAFLWASTANSATITIGAAPGLVVAPVAVTVPGNGAQAIACVACPAAVWGPFDANQITATGRPINPLPNILGSTSLQINGTGLGGTLRVFVTSQGNTDASNVWISSFTSNSLPSGWTVREQTFIDTANGLFTTTGATVTQLGDTLFNAIGTSVAGALAPSGNNYSVTHLYTIFAPTTGSALSTITLATPLPGALPLFATGLLGLWALRRKRKAEPANSRTNAA
jgi:hypothetical protein